MKSLALLLIALCVASSLPMAAQTVPPLMNYQGRLTDEAGAPLADGAYRLSFKLYSQSLAGSALWEEEQEVSIVQGGFNVILGTANPALTNAFAEPTRFLELTVVRDAAGSNVNRTILPRQQILSTPFAFEAGRAGVAESLNPAYLAGPLAASVLGTVPKRQVFIINGSWTAPANLSSPFVILWGCGGGGGGGGGGGDPITGSGTGFGGGGGGGGGAAPAFRLLAISPGTTYSITIGSGGSGGAGGSITTSGSSGNNGGPTIFGANHAVFYGGDGGGGGAVGQTNGLAAAGGGGWSNGAGGNGGNGANGSGSGGQSGQNSPYAAGGARGAGPEGRGGGGGAGVGSGANGGNQNAGNNGGPGQPAAANTGGGGGGGAGGAGGRSGGGGGAGGSGYLEILWFAPQ